jgi:hypothetical protein
VAALNSIKTEKYEMPLPEGYLPRKGDEVLIRARAKRDTRIDDDPETACYLEIVGKEHQSVFLPRSGIHSLYCRKWNVGDRVRDIGEPETVGKVVAAHDKYVWIRADKGDCMYMLTFEANELEAAPEQIAVETLTEAELLAGDRLI